MEVVYWNISNLLGMKMKKHFAELRTLQAGIVLLLIILFTGSCQLFEGKTKSPSEKNDTKYLYNPVTDLGELFRDVQLSGIFVDSKTFPDSDPILLPAEIAALYIKQKGHQEFDLKSFVDSHFSYPETIELFEIDNSDNDIISRLNSNWDRLVRIDSTASGNISSHIKLQHPYVVPGGRFREVYYWDSYFTMEGLVASGRTELVENMLANFVSLIDEYGYIPNGNRSYFLSRSQPPFFAEMVRLIMREKGDSAGLAYLPSLVKEYEFWMSSTGESVDRRTVKTGRVTLNRYWDGGSEPRAEAFREDYSVAQELPPEKREDFYRNIRAACESGWDFSSRWLSDGENLISIQTTDILPVDLNCLIYNIEALISQLYLLNSESGHADRYAELAEDRKCSIQELFWNEQAGYFFDYNFTDKKLSNNYTLAGVYPLYFGIATNDQAERVTDILHQKFLYDGGLVTTVVESGEQWDFPIGWAPLQWMAIGGLEKYRFDGFATIIAQRWMELNKNVYKRTGKMVEKYNVIDTGLEAAGGEYPLQDGFGWTNGVYLALRVKGYNTLKK